MWQSRPVFISSTFQDMQAERDYLRTHVFPELEERLRVRRHYLAWVDLRLGIVAGTGADEAAREAQVLKHCLTEVQRCKPFLIVLLGDRYGWVPPAERLEAAGYGVDGIGRSVTDLEIDLGALSDPDQRIRSWFYFRRPLPYADMAPSAAALYSDDYSTDPARLNRIERLSALKQRINSRLPMRVRHYAADWDRTTERVTGLEAFGRMVLEDLWAELAEETAQAVDAPAVSWQQAERDALEDFADDRARDFVGRQAELARLDALCTSPAQVGDGWCICVTGEPGSGKSALFGELFHRVRPTGAFVLAHAAGASLGAASVDSMLRRWVEELATALGTDEHELDQDAEPQAVEAAFASLLGRMASRRRVIVLVDALDQFESTPRARFATWIPWPWPANARLVATAVTCDGSDAVAERAGVELLAMPPLDAAEAHHIIAGICARYHRTLEPAVVEALLARTDASGPAWRTPLWLSLAVEELNLLDGDDFARAHRDYAGTGADRLRALMVDAVAGFPPDIPGLYAHTFARAEALFGANLARGFLGLIALSRAGWRDNDFRVLLPHTSRESWDELKFAQLRRVFRGQLRRRGALAQWNFGHAQMRLAARAGLAGWGLAEQSIHTAIAAHLLACAHDDPLHISETMAHLLAAGDRARAARYYGDARLSEAEVAGATRVLADTVIAPSTGTPATAAQELCGLLDGPDPMVCARVANRLLLVLDRAIAGNAPIESRLIIFDAVRQAFGRLLRDRPGFADWQRGLAIAHGMIGDAQVAQGELAAALTSHHQSRAIVERLARADPGGVEPQLDLATSHEKVGDVLVRQGDLSDALGSYRKSLAIVEGLAGADPGNARWQYGLSVGHGRVGDVQMARGELPGALSAYRDSLAIRERLARSDPGNPAWERDLSLAFVKVGDVQLAGQDVGGALESYRRSLAIIDRLARSDPGNAGWQRIRAISCHKVGDVQLEQGDLAAALESHRAGSAILERLTRADPGNAGLQHDLAILYERIGTLLLALGDPSGALKSCRDNLAITERLAGADPGNAGWQHLLSVSYEKIGDVQAARGERSDALKSHRDGLAIRERLARSDPGNAGWQRGLIVSCVKIAEVDRSQERVMLTRAVAIARTMQQHDMLAPADAWIPNELARRIAALPE